jgi:hypothetical protein
MSTNEKASPSQYGPLDVVVNRTSSASSARLRESRRLRCLTRPITFSKCLAVSVAVDSGGDGDTEGSNEVENAAVECTEDVVIDDESITLVLLVFMARKGVKALDIFTVVVESAFLAFVVTTFAEVLNDCWTLSCRVISM